MPITTSDDLSLAYTPGVARPCEAIAADPTLDAGATQITDEMKVAAVQALAKATLDPTADKILPHALDRSVAPQVAAAVAQAANSNSIPANAGQ